MMFYCKLNYPTLYTGTTFTTFMPASGMICYLFQLFKKNYFELNFYYLDSEYLLCVSIFRCFTNQTINELTKKIISKSFYILATWAILLH